MIKGMGSAEVVYDLNRVIKESLTEKVTSELRPEGNQRVSHVGIWGKFQAEGRVGEWSRVGGMLQ